MNEPDFHLERLLDDAANSFQPVMNEARLAHALAGRNRRRGLIVISTAAACMALLAGTAFAFRGDGPQRVSPANREPSRTTEPTRTEPADSEPKPTGPKATDPESTEPTETKPTDEESSTTAPDGEPTTTSRTEPPVTEPKNTEPKNTEPPTTEPKNTEPPTTEPKSTEPTTTEGGSEPVQWSAFQYNGQSDATPPYSVFYGTAEPGSIVLIASPYGGRDKLVGENGTWEVKVYFPDAPLNEPFQVWVSSGDHLDDFWFKRVG